MTNPHAHYRTVPIESVTVTTVVPYSEEPEFREYHAEGKWEAIELLQRIRNPQHAEFVVDVEVTESGGE